GSIVGAAWTTGRWPGKNALEFRNVSDRVRLSVPGETKTLTMAVWVRVNGLDRAFNSLFMSEGWGDRKIHWQIVREGKIRLGVAGTHGKGHTDYDTSVFFTPERFGRWMHLAVVFDPKAKEVRHYANGSLLARLPLKDASPLKIGIAELGNWNDGRKSGSVAIRHLSGAMDEFALWDRALGDAEIAALAK
ncbi:MAG: LamG domain-containing protein, partial [Prosthecobacter sp.]|nr:LamG domain-containing protein [Prosthecobacter sp.]